jgi:hypothetical protein
MEIQLFSPHLGQRKVINGFADSEHKFGIVSCGRQYGKSLLAQNLMLYWLLKSNKQKGAWITPVYNQCKKIFNEITSAANSIIKTQNKADLTITFINGSTLQFLSTDNYNTIRGFSFNYMVIDECAFIKKEAIDEAILPTLTVTGKKCLMISTPKSKNWFYDWFLRGSEFNNNYISFRGVSSDNPYVDKNFLAEQYKTLPSNIYKQEYEAEFTDAGNDVFTNLDLVCILNEWGIPNRNQQYYIGIDTGISSDYTVCTIQNQSGRIEKIIRFNGKSFEESGNIIIAECSKFNVVGGFCETNGIGAAMYEIIKPALKKVQPFISYTESKTKGVRKLIYDIQEGNIEMPSKILMPELFNEFSSYTYKISPNGNISFTHPSGYHDDIVDSVMMSNLARNEQPFTSNKIYIGGSKTKHSSFK